MYSSDPDLLAALRLSLIHGIGPRIRKNLLDRFGSAANVFRADVFQLRQVPEVGGKVISAILESRDETQAENELALCEQLGIRVLLDSDPEFPQMLKEVPDAPGLLFIKGKLVPHDNLALAVIGTRHASFYGERQTERLVGEFVNAGFSIVSGLARGIDGMAHKATLDVGGRTIAVLGHGLGLPVYPTENQGLAKRILDQGGALISEYAPRVPATQYTFPQRNRIIAGMALGTVVIEAGARSGTMVTARCALEYGRDVFALPGPVDSRVSTGCHKLIRDGARLLESVGDILEELGPIRERFPKDSVLPQILVEHPAEISLNETEKRIFDAIPSDGATVDELTQKTSLPVWKLMTSLTALEIKSLIKRGAGQRVFKV